jgi:coenzyme Q-binding protein COQ10
MPSFRTTRRVPHTALQMFDLVADVEKYPEFLPLCEDLRVRRRAQSGEGVETLVAEMSVGYKAIRETFTTRVTLDRTQLRIVVEYLEGPFSYLENRWTFEAEGAGCTVAFLIDYEFKSFTLGMLMGAMFDRAFRKFTDAFETRADAIYGHPAAASLTPSRPAPVPGG